VLDAVIVSDVHCDGPNSPTQIAFLKFLAGLRTRRLVLAGDIFHAFWAPRGEVFSAYAPVIAALADFDTLVLPGNHDWSLARALATKGTSSAAESIGTCVRTVLGELDSEISHGDEVDDNPNYRRLHAVLRGRGFSCLLDAVGPRGAWTILHRLAGTLGDGVPNARLVERQRTRAAARLSTALQLVVMGHTHAPECTPLPGGVFLNTGDWVRHRNWGAVAGASAELRRFDG